MKISVIISTYKMLHHLERSLCGFLNQTYSNFEMIIAEDCSDDDTENLVERFRRKTDINIKHVRQPDNGFQKTLILNKAIAVSEGEYLLFTDGDCIPCPDFIELHRNAARPGYFFSGGSCRLPYNVSEAIDEDKITNGDAFDPAWLKSVGLSYADKLHKPLFYKYKIGWLFDKLSFVEPTFNGNNSSCFKSDALLVNGFDTRMGYGGEDREFGYRLINAGLKPLPGRYTALTLHLFHERGYVDGSDIQKNRLIIKDTVKHNRISTDFGIN